MSEQTESRVRAEEAAEAARAMAEEALRRESAENEAHKARMAADHKRSLAMEAQVASVVATCLSAINTLAQDSTWEDTGNIDEMRDRVLRSLRAIYFPKPESAATILLDQVLPQIKPLLEAYFAALASSPAAYSGQVQQTPWRAQQVPGVGVGHWPPSYMQRPVSTPSPEAPAPSSVSESEFQRAINEVMRQHSGAFTASPDGTVTPPKPEALSRVKQYWAQIAPGLTAEELFELHQAAEDELENRGALSDDDEDDDAADDYEEDDVEEASYRPRASKRG